MTFSTPANPSAPVLASHPTYTLDQIIQHLTASSWGVDAWGNVDINTHTWHEEWGSPSPRLGFGDQLTYSLGLEPAVDYEFGPNSVANELETPGIVNMSAVQKGFAQLAFQVWGDLVPFSIVQNSDNNADITLNYSSASQSAAYTTEMLSDASNGDRAIGYANIWLASSLPVLDGGMLIGGYGLLTMEHEIGHALGLSHPGVYNAGSVGAFVDTDTYATDNRRYTIMSYFGYYDNADTGDWTQDGQVWGSDGGTDGGKYLYPQTPMVDDIAAIQSLYGADTGTRGGDTVYGFNCNITPTVKPDGTSVDESWIYDFNKNPNPIFTIWDGWGNDTLDCSGYAGPQTINLTPGSYSSVDGLTSNIGIAYGTDIENAIGGGGDDTLIVSYAYQDFHTVDGGGGNDTVDFSTFNKDILVDLSGNYAAVREPDGWHDLANLVSIENVVGGAGNDEISGNDEANRIRAGSGNDTIHGGGGKDTLLAGSGVDTIYGDEEDDTLVETYKYNPFAFDYLDGGTGTNTLDFGNYQDALRIDLSVGTASTTDSPDLASGTLRKVATLVSIQNVTGGDGNDEITGDSEDNTINGGGGINTAIFHGARSDYSITLLDNGYLQVADSVAGRDGTDLLKNIQTLRFHDGEFAAADIATQAHMESVDGLNVVYANPSAASGFHFALAGTGVQMAFGNAGNDVLDASGTSDYYTMLYGGAGKDTLIPGSGGSYTLQGGAGDDTAVFSGEQSDYTIDGSPAGWTSWAEVNDNATGADYWLQSVEHLQFADGTIDTPGLPPGGFSDVLYLDSSNPPASIGSGYDTVYVDNSHGPNPVHLNLAGTNVSFVYGGLGNDVFDASGVTTAVDLWGLWGDDVLIGGSGNDWLVGDVSDSTPVPSSRPGGGNDWLDGGAGNDWLEGGDGADTFVFRAGSGMDTVSDFDQTYPSSSSTMVHSNDHDVIRFEGGVFANFDALVASGDMTQSGADVVIKYGAADQVTMLNVNLSQLSANDFVFAVNTPPTLSSVAASVAFPGGKQVTLSPNVTVSDPDNRYLASATVTISGGTFNKDGDVLAANTTGTTITASYDSATETLMLTGSDVLAHYQQVLDSVTFTSTSSNPTHYGSNPTRTVTWVVNDGMTSNNVSTAATTTVNITATPPVDTPPVVTVSNLTATHGQIFTAAQLYSARDSDGDDIAQVEFWDAGTGGGHFLLNGVAQGTNQGIFVTAAQLSQLTYQSGSGADTLWVRANDGSQWSPWSSSFTVTAPIDAAPVETVANVALSKGQSTIAASSLFTATDADGDTISKYAFWNAGAGGGHFMLNGVAQGSGQEIDVSAAQLSQLSYQSGSGADTLWVRANDGYVWSAWSQSFGVSPWSDTPPTVIASSLSAAHGQSFAASSLFTAKDADGDAITKYAFWDAGSGGGHLVLNGVAQGVSQEIDVTAAQLSQLSYQSGSGADTLWVAAHDGTQWSGWSNSFSVTAPIDNGPTVTPTNSEIKSFANQNFAASSLFSYSDPFGSPATQYDFWDTGGGGGHFVLNGTALGANQHNIISATQLGQLSYQVGTGSDTIWVGANDGTVWGNWSKAFTISDPPAVAAGETITLGSSYAGQVDFLSDTGTLKLENSSSFAGTVARLCGQDAIDFADIGFGANSTLGYAATPDHSGGTLSVGDGTHMANIALLGSYMASTFAASSDGHGGTLISEAAQTSTQTPIVTQPHA